jgi:hypothetical protein
LPLVICEFLGRVSWTMGTCSLLQRKYDTIDMRGD